MLTDQRQVVVEAHAARAQSLKAVSQLAALLQDGGLWAPPPPRPPVPAFNAMPAAAQPSATAADATGSAGGVGSRAGGTPALGSTQSGDVPAAADGAAMPPAGRGPRAKSLPVKLVGFSKGGTVLNQVRSFMLPGCQAACLPLAGLLTRRLRTAPASGMNALGTCEMQHETGLPCN